MPFNGSGTFVVTTSGIPVVTGTVISSTMFNSLMTELSTGLSLTLTKDGQRVAREAHRATCTIVGAQLERLPAAKREAFLSALAILAADEA